MAQKSIFAAKSLSSSTFLINEVNDIFDESPFLYAIRIPSAGTIVLVDTGCGGRNREPDPGISSVREYLERVPLKENNGRPINEEGAMAYIVVLTHCHYDHIRTSVFQTDPSK
jgi:L-ascorbate metabolism protein UlaG (beta-lactamase superfamily)